MHHDDYAALEAENAKLQPSAVPDDHAEQALVMVPAGWKLVPVEPTPEMVSAAEEAHMPFGDMDIALRMAILSAPSAPTTVQGVNQQLIKALEAVLNSGRGTSGRIILDAQDEADVRAAITAARQEGGKV